MLFNFFSLSQESFKQTERVRQAENKVSQNVLQDIIENKNRRNPNKSIEINENVLNVNEMAKQISGKLASFSKENVIKEGNPKNNKMLQKTIGEILIILFLYSTLDNLMSSYVIKSLDIEIYVNVYNYIL